MKKLTAIIVGALIVSSAAFAQTNQVLSRNAVGYVKVALDSNKLYLVSNPFVNLDSADDPYLTNTFSVVPNGSIISIWDESLQAYKDFVKDNRGNWSGTGIATAKVKRADGVFISTGSGAADLFLMGEVPDRFTSPSNFVARSAGLTMFGYPYPVSTLLTQTVMAAQLPNGTVVSIWNEQTQSYEDAVKDNRGNWSGAAGFMLEPGRGIIVDNTSAGNSWYENKPYTWP